MSNHSIVLEAEQFPSPVAHRALSSAGSVTCKHCRNSEVRRLRRNLWERVTTPVTGVYPFLCRFCFTKFYAPLPTRSNHEAH
jgi:hypothetical protein